ncbi:hypothetical protein KIH74_22810 [Kineosporia sp. J2-2]|uniref:Uncharacterized protein n=1 Tax=Kineosporia corallincola TaxID=2835133 RepID=A0ABS5TLA3_9ACTN|nr:hypothetical protein [Kineosporia corallincola]MBT0771790.1 hypothetical protein [Kineosporia corallincola]
MSTTTNTAAAVSAGLHIPRPHSDQFTSIAGHLANSQLLRGVGMDQHADAEVQLAISQLRYLARVEEARETVEAQQLIARASLTEEVQS